MADTIASDATRRRIKADPVGASETDLAQNVTGQQPTPPQAALLLVDNLSGAWPGENAPAGLPNTGVVLAQFSNDGEDRPSQADALKPEWHLLGETDFLGGDLTDLGHRGVSIGRCEAICAASDQCRGYTYVPEKNWCWPKHDVSQPLDGRPGLVSALRTYVPAGRSQSSDRSVRTEGAQSEWRLLPNKDIAGGDLTDLGHRGVSIGRCEAICAASDQCRGYTYVPEKNWCWPKHDVSQPLEDKPGLMSALLASVADGRDRDHVASAPNAPDGACAGWNTPAFFQRVDAEEVQTCIAADMGLRVRDGNGWTPLHVAARYGTVGAVKALLDAKADINAESNDSVCGGGLDQVGTPLHVAARYGATEIFGALIAAGADIEAGDGRGDTPLRVTAATGEMAKVRMLLDAGADPNTQNYLCCYGCGGTVLVTAVSIGSMDMVRLLLGAGAAVDDAWGNSGTALMNAALIDDLAPVRFEMMQLLLDAGADPNNMDANGYTLMDYEDVHGDVEMVRFLLDAGADPENPQGSHRPLPHAVTTGDTQMVRLLLGAGANPGDGVEGDTLLHVAVRNGFTGIVSALVDAGADIEGRDSRGRTAMQVALQDGRTEIVDALRAAGVDVETGSRRLGRPPKFALE